MYIKLIQPKMRKRPMDTDIKIHMAPPLGLLTIVNLLRREHRVVLENENVQDIIYDDRPDIVGISVTVDTLPRAVKIAERFRSKGSIAVAGGIHITTAAAAVPPGSFDVLCIGAAEGTWPELIQDYEKGTLKSVYRCSEKFRGEDIVSPAYDYVDKGIYLYCNVVHTSRGCPFRCDFCYNSAKQRGYVNRRIEDVLTDIRAVRSRHIMFIDDNFAGNPAWTKEFLETIKPMKLKWNAAVSINAALDEGLLDLMKESGCQSLFIGFESINPDSVGNVHKVQNDTKKYEKAIRAIHERGIMVNASLVFGLDGDTKETFQSTLDWIIANKVETVTSHILTPYPGTALYNRMREEGRILTEDLSLYNTANVVFKPANMSAEELYEGYLWIYKQIYSLKNIIKRMPEKKNQRAAYLMFNLFYRKYGKMTDFLCKCISYKRIGMIAEKIAYYLR
ncbi:MAG: B12-binding domain-containing radical SAM protein [Lachnospiraceae bacterium]|nr:B12-binding domain-containing radical SAM protein [Lachnospiraceae bacterium]